MVNISGPSPEAHGMTKDAIITLSIKEAGPPGQGVFIFDVTVDGELVSSNQRLSPDESKALREISRIYGKLFEQWYCGGVRRPLMKMEEQSEISRKLYDLWLASSWEKIRSRVPVGGRRLLVVASIGHAQIKEVEPWVNGMASKLNYTREQFDSMLQKASESRQRDRGGGLIDAAFADSAPDPDKV